MNVLFVGDIVGKPGREAALSLVPSLRAEYSADLVIANAENVAGGWGITRDIVRMLLVRGEIDVITTGNHAFGKPESLDVYDEEPRLLRPANFPPGTPGRGGGLYKTRGGVLVGVLNIMGRALMEQSLDDPFRMVDEILTCARAQTPVLFIDFHAETTSEKLAFAWHCDGRVSAIIGTHTHVPTADERVLPGGTAYITDVGMCGPDASIIGMDIESVLTRFRTQMPRRFKVAAGPATLCGVFIDVDEATGHARHIERLARAHDG